MKTIDANPGYIMLDEFDSALDKSRKAKVFELYRDELARKMITLSPKSHEFDYLNYFSEAFAMYRDVRITRSSLIRLKKKMLHEDEVQHFVSKTHSKDKKRVN